MAGRTDPGKKRSNNEDALYFSEDEGFAVVADGMGGLEAGEVASQMAVQTMAGHFTKAFEERRKSRASSKELVGGLAVSCREWLQTANADLWLAAKSRERRHKMGATVAFFVACGDYLVVGNLGDARVYRMRDGKLEQLSKDHSWTGEFPDTIPAGEELRAKKFVTRALGIQSKIEPEFTVEVVRRGDLLLLCSDGLTGELDDAAITGILSKSGDELWPAVDRLISAALDHGGADNLSAVLARAV